MAGEVTYLAAFAGGLISFASPCVLPIVPAYLSLIGGVSLVDLQESRGQLRLRIVRDTSLFVAGFSAVFVLLGLSVTAVGGSLFRNQDLLTRLSGGLVLAMAMFLLVTQFIFSPRLLQEKRFHPQLQRFGPFAAPIAGAAFGFGWTPCLGPVLASVLAIASSQAAVTQGGFLLVAYSLGLGIPFLLTGMAFGRLTGGFNWIKPHLRSINIAAALVMAFFGLLLLTDRFTVLVSTLQRALEIIGLGSLIELG